LRRAQGPVLCCGQLLHSPWAHRKIAPSTEGKGVAPGVGLVGCGCFTRGGRGPSRTVCTRSCCNGWNGDPGIWSVRWVGKSVSGSVIGGLASDQASVSAPLLSRQPVHARTGRSPHTPLPPLSQTPSPFSGPPPCAYGQWWVNPRNRSFLYREAWPVHARCLVDASLCGDAGRDRFGCCQGVAKEWFRLNCKVIEGFLLSVCILALRCIRGSFDGPGPPLTT